ncbi:hypothetical protein V498_05917 [Pseudogymnoascus sp. VKM F-4517 (FW-2822)]|nr:hypothetical protein V498_05917 [Pseudogymnoascus sp. VKM F-4517 (FW-2822)]
MEPSFKRQRISAMGGQQRHSPGYDGHSRSYDLATLRQPRNSNSSAIYNGNNGSTGFYEATNARESSADFEFDDDEESGEESYEEEAPEADLQATRQKLDNKLKSTFEAIFEKYGKDFSGVGDEIDLRTGEIIVDNGHVAEMHAENDAGEERGRGMLRAFTEEPEQARFPQHIVEDSDDMDDVDELLEDTGTDYYVRGRQMLRAFTQEPELGQEPGIEEDENDYDGDMSKLHTIDEDESDDDDILYQSSGVISAKSMAPPPRPPLHKPYQAKPQSRFHVPKHVPRLRPSSSAAAYPSEPDILAQFGQELGPRIAEYVSRQKSVDEGNIDPKWRTPALPAATAGKRPIIKSIILQPDTERSPSPNGNSLWAPEKKPRRRRRKADKKDIGPSGGSETVISREGITGSRVSTQVAGQPGSAHIDAPQNPPQEDLVSDSEHQYPDGFSFGGNEHYDGGSLEESVADDSHDSAVLKRRHRRPGMSGTWVPRNKYTDAEDKQILEWAKWAYNETEYGFWGEQHWDLLSKKNPRHSGTSYRQRYRKMYDRSGGRHPFLEPGVADQDAPKDSTVQSGLPTETGATVSEPRSDQAPRSPPFSRHTFAKTTMAFQDVSKPLGVQPIPPAEDSSIAHKSELTKNTIRPLGPAQRRFEPFKNIIQELYVGKGYSLKEVIRIMKRQYQFIECKNQYRRQFRKWGFEQDGLAIHAEGENSLRLYKADGGQSEDVAKGPEYAGMTREERKRLREERREQREQLKEMAKGVPLPTPDPEDIERTRAQNEERRVKRMKLLEEGQLLVLGHDEIEKGNEETEENTSTRNKAGEYQGNDEHEGLPEWGNSYDLSKLLQGASDYISPSSPVAMGEDQTVELPQNRNEHSHEPRTNYASRSLRSRVIPNSQSSQDLLSPSTSQAQQYQVPTAPMMALSNDDLGPSYMFSDEEDEATPVAPQTRPSNPHTSYTPTEFPKHQLLSDSAPLITPPAQEPDIPPQSTPMEVVSTEQPDVVISPGEIKDEPESISRGLDDIYSLPCSPPPLPTVPQAATSGGALRVIITQPATSSPLTSPAARTPTPPTILAAPVTQVTPKQSPALESTPRRSQTSLVRLSSSTPTRRNPMERSTSRPRLTSRSMTGSAHSRASMTPISRLAIGSPLRHDAIEDGDEDEDGGVIQPSSRRSKATVGAMSSLTPRRAFSAGVPVARTPSRRGRVASANGGGGGDGELIQTPGGAWRRCGESGYKCGRGFCFMCSVDGDGGVGV